MNKNIFLLWQGQFVSQFGTQAYSIAMMYFLMEATGSSGLMGLIMMLGMLPAILAGPLAGVFVDSLSRKSIIIGADIIRGIGVLTVAGLMLFMPQKVNLIIFAFAIVVAMNNLARAFFQPAIHAAIPDLTEQEKLDKTNALFQSTTQFTQVVGQAVGGVLYKTLGAPLLLIIDGISYLLSALSEAFIKMPQTNKAQKTTVKQAVSGFKDNFTEGLKYVKGVGGMFSTMLYISSLNFFVAPVLLLLPFYAEHQIKGGVVWYGYLLAALAVGTIVGSIFTAKRQLSDNQRPKFMFLAMHLAGLSVCLLGWTDNHLIGLLAMFLLGSAVGMFNVPGTTLFQCAPPVEMRGRVFSLLHTIISAAMPLGFLFGGIAGELTDKDMFLIYLTIGIGIVFSTLWVASNRTIVGFMAGSVTKR